MSGAEFRLRGGPELVQLLDQLPKNWARRVLRNGARAAAVVIQKGAKQRVRKRTGKLEKAIKVSSRMDGDLIIARVRVKGGKGSHAFLAPFLEYGVSPHLITVHDDDRPTYKTRRGVKKMSIKTMNKAAKRGSLKIGENFVGPFVMHPGHPPFPFLRPALDQDGQEAINAMGQYVHAHLSWNELQAPQVQVIEDEE